jgi:hypothetical protein
MPQHPTVCGGNPALCQRDNPTCGSTTNCTVSGSYCDDEDCGNIHDFSQTWNGTAWNLSTVPTLSGQVLRSCAGRSFCMNLAMHTERAAKAEVTRNWGQSWHDVSANLAAACSHLARCGQEPQLSCGSPRFCMVLPSALATFHPAAALTWNGATWRTVPLAQAGGTIPDLTFLSCGSPRNCAAIGTYKPTRRSTPRPVAEHWNGTAWHLTPMPAP